MRLEIGRRVFRVIDHLIVQLDAAVYDLAGGELVQRVRYRVKIGLKLCELAVKSVGELIYRGLRIANCRLRGV